MEDNPYVKILQMIRNEAKGQIPATLCFGEVISASPIKVVVSNNIQEPNDLVKNAAIGELKSGDSVLLVPFDDNQKYLILCKVVVV